MIDPPHNPRKSRLMQSVRKAIRQVPGWSGRWSLVHVPGILGEALSLEERAQIQAIQLLDRYGIVAREFHRREDLLPWGLIAAALQRMEMRGEIRRGYFVKGLSGMQFAHRDAIATMRKIRSSIETQRSVLLINACDPSNPFGAGLNYHKESSGKTLGIARNPSNYVVFQHGVPVLLLEGYGARIWTLAETREEIMAKGLRIFIQTMKESSTFRSNKSLTVEHINALRPAHSAFEPLLRSLGFVRDRNQSMVYEGYV